MTDIQIGDTLKIINEIPDYPLLKIGFTGDVVNILNINDSVIHECVYDGYTDDIVYHVRSNGDVFVIYESDIKKGYAICINKIRNKKLTELGIEE